MTQDARACAVDPENRYKLTRVHVSPSEAWEVQSRVLGVLHVAPGAVPAANFSLSQDADGHEAQGFLGYLRWLGAKRPFYGRRQSYPSRELHEKLFVGFVGYVWI